MNIASGTYFIKAATRKPAVVFLFASLLIGLLAPILANKLPLAVSVEGKWYFPAFNEDGLLTIGNSAVQYEHVDWNTLEDALIIHAPVRYSPGASDFTDAGYSAPFSGESGTQGKHWLGTGKRGEDILSGIIHGTRVSMTVAIFSMLIAGSIGIVLGAAAGYLGDHSLRIQTSGFWLMAAGLVPACFYAAKISGLAAPEASLVIRMAVFTVVLMAILLTLFAAGRRFKKAYNTHHTTLPLDTVIMKVIELISSLPVLLLILAIAAITAPSVSNLVWIIGLTSWTEIARLTRAEVLKLRETDFISSAKAAGIPTWRIVKNHLIPNAMTPVYVSLAFGAGGAILAESGLSFLGVGVPPETVTWGRMIADGRQNFDAWWMVVFPGCMISATVMSFYALGRRK